jgi:hypothetical protein
VARSRAVAGRIAVPDPAADAAGFVDAVADAANRISAAAVLPGTEQALLALAGRETHFSPHIRLGAPSPEIVAQATQKAALAKLGAAAGFEVPSTLEIDLDTLDDPRITYPAVVKPVRSETAVNERLVHGYGCSWRIVTSFGVQSLRPSATARCCSPISLFAEGSRAVRDHARHHLAGRPSNTEALCDG